MTPPPALLRRGEGSQKFYCQRVSFITLLRTVYNRPYAEFLR